LKLKEAGSRIEKSIMKVMEIKIFKANSWHTYTPGIYKFNKFKIKIFELNKKFPVSLF